MENLGFHVEEIEQSIYRCRRGEDLLLVWMHVDDGVVFTNSGRLAKQIVEEAEKYCQRSFFPVKSTLPDQHLTTCFDRPPVDQTKYQHFIGCLNYLALGTRPDWLC